MSQKDRVFGGVLLGAILGSIIGILIFNLATIYLEQRLDSRFLFERIDLGCSDFQRAEGFESLPTYFIWFSIMNVFSAAGVLKQAGIQVPNLTCLLPMAIFGGLLFLPGGKYKRIGIIMIIAVAMIGLAFFVLSAFALAHGVCA